MKTVSRSTFTIPQILILFLFFLASVNVGNLYYYFLLAAFLTVFFVNIRHVIVDKAFVIILLFSIFYLIFCPETKDSFTTIIKQFSYPMCYVLGLNLVGETTNDSKEHKERQRKIAVIIPAIGTFVHYLLNMVINFNSIMRNTEDIWTGDTLSATGQACLALVALGVFVAWLFSKTSTLTKVFAAIGIVLALMYNFVLAGRTMLLLLVVVLLVAFVFSVKTSSIRRKGIIFCSTVLIILLALTVYMQNWFGIQEWIRGSNFSLRFDNMGLSEDARIDNKKMYFNNMWKYPFGGGYLREIVGEYAHELFLDVYSEAGAFAYGLIITFVIIAVVVLWQIVRSDLVGNNFKLLILCAFSILLIEFFLEPILLGMPWMFDVFCYYSGLLSGVKYYRCENSMKSSKGNLYSGC